MTQAKRGKRNAKVSSARVARREDMTDDLFRIWLEPISEFDFRPGQYCTIGIDGIERAYSIASSPSEPLIELFIELIPPPLGHLTPLLHKLKVGDEVTIRPRAKGLFVFEPAYRNHVMIATVTGVTPFISILRSYFEAPRGGDRFYVLEGASYHDEFGYDDELRQLARERDEVVFVPSVSRPDEARNADWHGAVGRINTLLDQYLADFGLRRDETIVYACGHPGMIEDVRARLAVTEYAFTEERFWPEGK